MNHININQLTSTWCVFNIVLYFLDKGNQDIELLMDTVKKRYNTEKKRILYVLVIDIGFGCVPVLFN